jgi:proline iminopeptidase
VDLFASYDGTELGYRVLGEGPQLVCLPGGPGRAAQYLGGLGGLDESRRLVLLNLRGVGSSADPADPATLRVDRQVEDVESLRMHLGLTRMDLLAHSAGAVLATLYAATYPQHVSRLVLVTPGLAAIGVSSTREQVVDVIEQRAGEPWYRTARDGLEDMFAGNLSMAAFEASRPLFYGRWDDDAQRHATVGMAERHMVAREGYFADVTLDPSSTLAGLARLSAPVLLYAGDLDPTVTPALVRQAAPLFNDATVVVQRGASHFPWIDDPVAFAAATRQFLG